MNFGREQEIYPGVAEKVINDLKAQVAVNPSMNLIACGFDGDEFNEDESVTLQVKIHHRDLQNWYPNQ